MKTKNKLSLSLVLVRDRNLNSFIACDDLTLSPTESDLCLDFIVPPKDVAAAFW